jgi:hypothetical protein
MKETPRLRGRGARRISTPLSAHGGKGFRLVRRGGLRLRTARRTSPEVCSAAYTEGFKRQFRRLVLNRTCSYRA